MQTPGQAHDQRDLVILANKKKVSEPLAGTEEAMASQHGRVKDDKGWTCRKHERDERERGKREHGSWRLRSDKSERGI